MGHGLLLGLLAAGCGGSPAEDGGEAHALQDAAFRFCHEPGLDADDLESWCEVAGSIPEERCPGLRASCDGAEAKVSADGCGGEGGPSADGERAGTAGAPEPPPKPWSLGDWSAPDLAFLEGVAQWVMAILVAVGVGVFLYFLWRRFGARDRGPAEAPTLEVGGPAVAEAELDEALPEVPSAPSDDLLAMARRALDEGRAGEAVVLARGASLRRLGELGRLRLHRSRTDREYVRALRRGEEAGEAPEGSSDELRVVVQMAERFRFGHRQPPRGAAADALAAAARLLGALVLLVVLMSGSSSEALAQTPSRYRPHGDAALADLFRLHGYDVRWRLRDLSSLDDPDVDVIVLDALAVTPTPEEWEAMRGWVGRGHVLFVLGDAQPGFPELGPVEPPRGGPLRTLGPVRAAGLAPPVLPGGAWVYRLDEATGAPDAGDPVGPAEAWVEDGAGGAAVAVLAIGQGAVVSAADFRFGDNVALAVPANEELLGELLYLGQATRGWPIVTPGRVQLALRASIATEENQANNPLESLARAELLPFVVQFLLLWTVIALWRGWPMGPLRDPPERGRIRFADHVEALGDRYERLRASRYALKAYAGLWLQRLGPKGLALAATASGMGPEEAKAFVADLEALVEGPDDEGAGAHPSARGAQADFERMEALWRMVEHPREPSEGSP